MPVTEEDLRNYDKFLISMANELSCISAPKGPLLWHYTNGVGLLGILETHSLFSTQVSCLNDAEEIKYASRVFKAALMKLVQEKSGGVELPAEIIRNFETEDENFPGTLPYFVGCFSELEDDISQWKGYGRGINGYAVGFVPAGLIHMGGLLLKVNYDKRKHEEVALKVAKATFDFHADGLKAKRAATAEQWTKEFLAVWEEKITQLAPLIKNPRWAPEEEYRIVRLLMKDEMPALRIIQKDTMMTRHLPMKMSAESKQDLLPIAQVIVGPCQHPSTNRVSVDTALRQHGYLRVLVRSSECPYRAT